VLYTSSLTKIQTHFKLENAMDELLLERIGDAQAIYGIERITLNRAMTGMEVEYDATRLRPAELEARLRSCGLAVERA
jgi:allophanate hydrolase subunit 1